jgi:hypothetical protein
MAISGDPIDNYLVWELCKKEGLKRKIIEGNADGDSLKKELVDRVRQEYRENQYDRSEKINLLKRLDSNPDYRSKVLRECSWRKETVGVEDLGTTLPRAGDLPPEIIAGSLPEVVDFVRQADPKECRSVDYIMALKEVPEVLDEFLPWVVTPGDRLTKQKRMERVHGENNWDIEDTWGMINDGNHRVITKILAEDLEEISCFVGRRRDL